MHEARQAGIRLAIASTTSPENIEPLIRAGFGSRGAELVRHHRHRRHRANKKPAPDIYNAALKALGVAPAARHRSGGFRDRRAIRQGRRPVHPGHAEPLDPVAGSSRRPICVLGSLGDPDEPLSAADERRLGAKYLAPGASGGAARRPRWGTVNAEAV